MRGEEIQRKWKREGSSYIIALLLHLFTKTFGISSGELTCNILNAKMETKLNIFFKSEKEVDSRDAVSTTTTFASSVTTSGVDTRKYIKISRTLEKRASPGAISEVRMLTPKSMKGFDTTVFICEEEKLMQRTPSKIKKKREVLMEDKGTEEK
ncbi:EF-hand calcium-binding domain-containing protein 13 [Petaurus breviceps papuanus]|uniref:EF-hand calcium-binding domain-containing protein 13 n=1 Tax=Petaurus breviceps papuanus TaxID=3040969 RepID=UPI0036DA64D8